MISFETIHFAFLIWTSIFLIVMMLTVNITKTMNWRQNRSLIHCIFVGLLINISGLFFYNAKFYPGSYTNTIASWSYFYVILLTYILVINVSSYIRDIFMDKNKDYDDSWRRAVIILEILGIVTLCLSRGTQTLYLIEGTKLILLPYFGVLQFFWIIGILVIFGYCVRNRHLLNHLERQGIVLSYIVLSICLIIQIIKVDMSFSTIFFNIYLYVLFVFYQLLNAQEYTKMQKEIAYGKLREFKKQIQPHFIFNCLNIIKYLIRTDTHKAIETTDELSSFLRTTIDTDKDLIPIEKEIEFVTNYLKLEQKRFQNLYYELEIHDSDYLIPPFCIQILVENAIKHGIRQKMEDGHVTILLQEDDTMHYVDIIDDGVGFDEEEVEKTKPHTGLTNIRNRIELLCHGDLIIHSTLHSGTHIRIEIPKESLT